MPIDDVNVTLLDPSRQIYHRFGNLTSVGTSEVLVCGRTYTDPGGQAGRSVVSTSASDTNGGAGANIVRITYLDNSFNLATEDVPLNGTTPVNTVSTTIRYIQKFEVVKGAAAVGAVKIMTLVAGGGTEITGIGAATMDAFLCHHYVQSGKTAFVLGWGAVASLNANMKLTGQATPNGVNLVDQTWDLDNLNGPGTSVQGRIEFSRGFRGQQAAAGSYVRVTAVPSAVGAVIRAYLDVTEM